jgi:hypothetical protein
MRGRVLAPKVKAMSADQRREQRQACRHTCWIILGPDRAPIECHIHNISKDGAFLVLPSGEEIPDEFQLAMTANLAVVRLCRVAWSDGQQVGVQFKPANAASLASRRVYC